MLPTHVLEVPSCLRNWNYNYLGLVVCCACGIGGCGFELSSPICFLLCIAQSSWNGACEATSLNG